MAVVTNVLTIISIIIGITALSLAIKNSVERKKEDFITSQILTEREDQGNPNLSSIDLLSTLTSAINDTDGPLFNYTARPGMIVMWHTNVAPKGWVLCDGGKYGDLQTPDLRGRFPKGVSPDDITYAHKGGISSVMLSSDNVPAHNHQISLDQMPQTGKVTECLVAPKDGKNFGSEKTFYTSDNGRIYSPDYSGPITQKAFDIIPPCVGVYFIMKLNENN
tara:strand:- start:1405 stop:2064 length:660 start_codon:yes stop_codon:yes gene_type:complete